MTKCKTFQADEAYLETLHTLVLTIGFQRSGSSLIGFLLTAHPDMVVVDEPAPLELDKLSLIEVCNKILSQNERFYKRVSKARTRVLADPSSLPRDKPITKLERRYRDWIRPIYNAVRFDKPITRLEKRSHYVFVPNQWQGTYRTLRVIGIKDSYYNTMKLAKNDLLSAFKDKIQMFNSHRKMEIRIKFILTIRNPYDMLATHVANGLNKRILLDEQAHRIAKLLRELEPHDVFTNRHEDMVNNPTRQLSKICNFLGVEASPDYISDCASVIDKKLNKNRYELNWRRRIIDKWHVRKLIKEYDFLSGYSWKS